MSVSTHRCFASSIGAVILAMVCLVEPRPPSEAMKVGLAHEAVTEWNNSKKGEAFVPIGNQTVNEHHATSTRTLNHLRRSSNESGGGIITDNARHDNGTKNQKKDIFVFPGMIAGKPEIREKFEPDPKIFKACANGESYCTDLDDYPAQRIMDVLSNHVDKFQAFFGNDKVKETNIVHRIDGAGETPLCESEEETVSPKAAQNENNKPLFIVNHPSVSESLQVVRVETCKSKEKACNFAQSFPNGYRATCHQKYIYRRLLAIDPKTGDPYPDFFLFPSCCVCKVKMDPNIASRMGFLPKPDTTPVQRNNSRTNMKNSDDPIPLASEVTTANSEKMDAAKNTTQKPAPSQTTSSKIVFMDNPSVPLPLTEGEVEEETAV